MSLEVFLLTAGTRDQKDETKLAERFFNVHPVVPGSWFRPTDVSDADEAVCVSGVSSSPRVSLL